MCGRYVIRSDKQRIAEAFHVASGLDEVVMPPWDYNVAPSTFQPVIRQSRDTRDREIVLMRWGLIPFFSKSLKDVRGISTINARAESLSNSPAWREPLKKRRCIVPADAFYEWQKLDDKTKQPFAFNMNDVSLFGFAGLWDAWKDEAGQWLQSLGIITTEANELTSKVHTRMPVILHRSDYTRWLDRDIIEQPPIDLLRPYESDAMNMQAANVKVGNVRNNGPEMLNSE